MLLNCGVGEHSWDPLDCKEIQPVHSKGDQSWLFIGRIDAEVEAPILWPPDISEELTPWKRPWCWERLKARGEGDDRGWDGWMASWTLRTWVWVNSGSWWWTGRPGMLWFTGSQRAGHNWATELNWTEGLLTSSEFILRTLDCELLQRRDTMLFTWYPLNLEHCLPHSKHSIDISGMNE